MLHGDYGNWNDAWKIFQKTLYDKKKSVYNIAADTNAVECVDKTVSRIKRTRIALFIRKCMYKKEK